MKKLLSLLTVSALIFTSCSTDSTEDYEAINQKAFTVTESFEDALGKSTQTECATAPILAVDSQEAGEIIVKSDGEFLFITYKVHQTWQIDATNLYLGDLQDVPTNSSGNPRLSLFPYRTTHGNHINNVQYKIPLNDIASDCFTLIGHAVITRYNDSGTPIYCTNSWVYGDDFGANAMATSICKNGCSVAKKQPVIAIR